MSHDPSHWDEIYGSKSDEELSWSRSDQGVSLDLLSRLAPPPAAVIDVGGGRSGLAAALLAAGWEDVTVLDLSAEAIRTAGLPAEAGRIVADVTAWVPDRTVGAWHDRAVLHFLLDDADRQAYAAAAASTVRSGGVAIIGTFAPDGPERCSGLEVHRSSALEVGALLEDGFTLEERHDEVHQTPWGAEQHFAWAVLRRR
jgi:hypothetical protein